MASGVTKFSSIGIPIVPGTTPTFCSLIQSWMSTFGEADDMRAIAIRALAERAAAVCTRASERTTRESMV